jgi:DNA polymerase
VTDLGKQASLDYIAEQALTCKRCRLGDSRTRVVFGDGNANARIVFVGEGPGAHEDACGLPFVGKAGQLLTKMLAAIGIARQDVYITNIVKCRPPNNREPQVDEIAACRPFLNAQLEVIAPSVLVSLGRPSAQTLLADTRSLTELRRMKHKYGDIDMLVTYHPAFLLRNPSKKRGSWADLLALARLMTRKGLRAEEAEPWWR